MKIWKLLKYQRKVTQNSTRIKILVYLLTMHLPVPFSPTLQKQQPPPQEIVLCLTSAFYRYCLLRKNCTVLFVNKPFDICKENACSRFCVCVCVFNGVMCIDYFSWYYVLNFLFMMKSVTQFVPITITDNHCLLSHSTLPILGSSFQLIHRL